MYESAKKEFEKFYDSLMDVWINEMTKDEVFTRNRWVKKHRQIPCRVSQKQLQVIGDNVNPESAYQTILYCDPSVNIPAGSRVVVFDVHKNKREYRRSSEGFKSYRTHQEIQLVRELTA